MATRSDPRLIEAEVERERRPETKGERRPETKTDAKMPELPFQLPNIETPKGGGAIRSISERFQANAATGTGSLALSLGFSPGRNGFGPQLALSYDSGAGNGPCGLGWSCGAGSVSRKTSKGVPRYVEGEDTFVWSGEDLVQVGAAINVTEGATTYRVERYRPKVERTFTRIERWRVAGASGDPGHWRTYSPEDVRSIFGRSPEARISDPARPAHVFEWLLEEQWDMRGSAIRYVYKAEELTGAVRYLKRVFYGNATPLSDLSQPLRDAPDPRWRFEAVFDFGEHTDDRSAEIATWPVRQDPFSRHRSGFELRTYRLLRRVLMFHRFPELGANAATEGVLVRSTTLVYDELPLATKLIRVEHRGHRNNETIAAPPVELEYSPVVWDTTIHTIERDVFRRPPPGVDGQRAQWVDFDGEGLPGVLTATTEAWWYERPEGGGRLGPARLIMKKPAGASPNDDVHQLLDLQGDGRLDVVRFAPIGGYFEQTGAFAGAGARDGFAAFRPFESLPRIDLVEGNVRFFDATGHGLADAVLSEGDAFIYYRSIGDRGFAEGIRIPLPRDEQRGPRVVFADATSSIFLADMTGDGLSDIVRVEHRRITYWPSLGHGRFGARVTMSNPPLLDNMDRFDARRVRLADLDGSGPADLIYLSERGAIAYLNQSGNSWSSGQVLSELPLAHKLADVTTVDLLGHGTTCLVWSTRAPDGTPRLSYVEPLGPEKPHLLVRVRNNLGGETRIRYTSSTTSYLAARGTSDEWVTRLHFPVQVVDRVEHEDFVTNARIVQRFRYHHGYYDPEEREFNGFGLAEEWDEETFAEARGSGRYDDTPTGGRVGWVPPVYTRTWFHTGASREHNALEAALLSTARANPGGLARLEETVLPPDLLDSELADARRALRGQMLRQEVYGLDESPLEAQPYLITEQQMEVRRIDQGAGGPVFAVVPRETRTFHVERDAADARVTRELALEISAEDARYGHVRRTAVISFGRDQGPAAQTRTWVQSAENTVEHHDVFGGVHRIRQTLRARSWEIVGIAVARDTSLETIRTLIAAGQQRLISDVETLYWNVARDAERAPDTSDPGGYVRRVRALAVPAALENTVFGVLPGYPAGSWLTAGHERVAGDVWASSGVAHYATAAEFNLAERTVDPFGNASRVFYDPHRLFAVRAENALGHAITSIIDYHALAPREVIDANLNHVELEHDALGAVTRLARKGKELAGGAWEGRTLAAPHALYAYGRNEWIANGRPCFARAETFTSHDPADTTSIVAYTYTGGFGQEVLTKTQAEPGPAPLQDPVTGDLILDGGGNVQLTPAGTPRWIGSGRVVLNNKGEPFKEYAAYFSSIPAFDDEPALIYESPAAIFHYDALGRLTRTQFPDGTETRVEHFTWSEVTYDRSDIVAGSRWAADAALSPDPELQRALTLSLAHDDTPATQHLDAFGRVFRVEENNGTAAAPVLHASTMDLDIQGRVVQMTDARGNVGASAQYDLLGRVLRSSTADGGTRWTLPSIDEQPAHLWDERGQHFEQTYDALRRPIARRELGAQTRVRELVVYGDLLGVAAAQAVNLLGHVHRAYDAAGLRAVIRRDFDGNVVESQQRLRATPAAAAPIVDWSAYALGADWSAAEAAPNLAALLAAANPMLEAETFTQLATFDALGRLSFATAPDGTTIRHEYNFAGLLERIDVRHPGGQWTPYVTAIDYDSQERRERIVYGQGVETTYDYHPHSRRMINLRSQRAGNGTILQDLRYTHDSAGNVVAIIDGAQQTTFFQNAVVSPDRRFIYDARNRLIEAEGRAHPGQQPTNTLPPERQIPHANDASTLVRYTESYVYDAVGNILEMAERRGMNVAWRRRYQYALASNRLLATSASMAEPDLPSYADPLIDPLYLDHYTHDVHGNLTSMPGLGPNVWDGKDQLVHVPLGGGGDAFYIYDAAGQRVRKVIRRANGADMVERIYLAGWEVYRRRLNGALDEEIETLHVEDDARRVALIETRTRLNGAPVARLPRPRFQLDDHLGTAALELDGTPAANVITYEEHYPYGATAYRATRAGVDVSAKRYRYSAKERDEETGLDYFGERYYASWLGRWTAADPNPDPEQSLYAFSALSPQGYVDPDGAKEIPIGFIYTLTLRENGRTEVYVGKAADLRQRLLAKGSKEHHHFRDMIRKTKTEITARAVYADLKSALPSGAARTRQALDKARDAALLVAEQDELNRVRSSVGRKTIVKNVVEALKDENIDDYRSKYKVRSASGSPRLLKEAGQSLAKSKLSALARGKSKEFVKLRRGLSAAKGISKKNLIIALAIIGNTLRAEGAEAAVVEALDVVNPASVVGLSLKDKYDENKAEGQRRWDELVQDMAVAELESMVLDDAIGDVRADLEGGLDQLEQQIIDFAEETRREVEQGRAYECQIPTRYPEYFGCR